MARANSISMPASRRSRPAPAPLLNLPELEKISCSTRAKNHVHPLHLIGKRVVLAECMLVDPDCSDGAFVYESSITTSTVLADSLGSIKHGVTTKILLQDDGLDDTYYSDIANLTILEVL